MKRVIVFRVLTILSVIGLLFCGARQLGYQIVKEDMKYFAKLNAQFNLHPSNAYGEQNLRSLEEANKPLDLAGKGLIILFLISLPLSFQRRPRVTTLGCSKQHDADRVGADLRVRPTAEASPAATETTEPEGESIQTQPMDTTVKY